MKPHKVFAHWTNKKHSSKLPKLLVCRSAPFLSRLITLELYERIRLADCCTVDRKASRRGLGRVHQQSNGKFIQRRAAVFVSGLSSKQPTDEYRGAIEEMRRKSVQWISIRPDGVAPSAAERRNITRKKRNRKSLPFQSFLFLVEMLLLHRRRY